MAEYEDREHYIPLRKSDLVTLLAGDAKVTPAERGPFRQFCTLVTSVWHFEYHGILDELKDAYAPFDPDADTQALDQPSPEQMAQREEEVFAKLTHLMEKANFEAKSEDDVTKALEGASEGGINMDVDLNVFEKDKWRIFARGDTVEEKTVRRWYKLWRKETIKEDVWKRLVLVFKLRKHKRLAKNLDFGKIYVRVYKDIPKMDLETLIPGAKPEMTRLDKINIMTPLLSGAGALVYKVFLFVMIVILGVSLFGKFSTKGVTPDEISKQLDAIEDKLTELRKTMSLEEALDSLTKEEKAVVARSVITNDWDNVPPGQKAYVYFTSGAFLLLIMGLGMYAFKSYSGYLNTKNKYEKNLSQALYYQTLDSNAGVLFRLLDEAEEQEVRETLLAYFYLWKYAPADGWTQENLDDYIEMELEAKLNLKVDFEVDDAIAKLEKLGIVTKEGDKFTAVPLEKALELLDYRWDHYFEYNNA